MSTQATTVGVTFDPDVSRILIQKMATVASQSGIYDPSVFANELMRVVLGIQPAPLAPFLSPSRPSKPQASTPPPPPQPPKEQTPPPPTPAPAPAPAPAPTRPPDYLDGRMEESAFGVVLKRNIGSLIMSGDTEDGILPVNDSPSLAFNQHK